MKPYVTYFGDGRYRPLLERFLAEWHGLGPERPISILTDLTTPLPAGVAARRVDPRPWLARHHRPGNPGAAFDYKGALILALISPAAMDEPALVLDCDNRVYRDPVPLLAGGSDTFAIGADSGRRSIVHPAFPGLVVEESSSILCFPAQAQELADAYRRLWAQSTEPANWLLEQRTWSLVAHQFAAVGKARVLPRIFSWSRAWDPQPANCVMRHCHGGEKWTADVRVATGNTEVTQ